MNAITMNAFRIFFTAWLALAPAMPCLATPAAGSPRAVVFPSHDGFELRGKLWPAGETAPGILLLHQCDADQSMYDELGSLLQSRGFHVLAFDFRGLGESVGEGFDLERFGGREDWDRAVAEFPSDVEAAHAFLGTAVTLEEGRLGILGASCGGGQAIRLARSRPEIAALAILSARLSPGSLESLAALRSRPILAIAAEGDRRAAEAARATMDMSSHPSSRAILYDGRAHGQPLFRNDPELLPTIADWFRDQLLAVDRSFSASPEALKPN